MADTRWSAAGSNEEYWRSDNPLIMGWWRFGDESESQGSINLKVPDDSGNRDYASGLLVDSGPQQHHLLHHDDVDAYLRPTSGIAPWSSSGVIFGEQPSSTWGETATSESMWINPESFYDATTGGNRGLGIVNFGSNTTPSGFTIMGWAKIPDTATNTTTQRQIFGNWQFDDFAGGTSANFRLVHWPERSGENRILRASIKLNTTTPAQAHVDTLGDNFPTSPTEEFFVAVQVHREYNQVSWDNNGSGLLKIFLGTPSSGIRLVAETPFSDSDMRLVKNADTTNFYTFGQSSDASHDGTSTAEHLPPLSELDEWVAVNDGFMTIDRMAYYMNHGINQLVEEDPTRPEFAPVSPGADQLVAYWTFDDQTGTNSAPATSGLGLDIVMDPATSTNIQPVPGIRGGSGIRTGNEQRRGQTLGSNGGADAFPHVPRSPGLNFLFPDVTESDQWTWIGWMDPRSDGNSTYGGVVGHFAASSTNHTAWGIGNWNGGTANVNGDDQGRGVFYAMSGTDDTQGSGPGSAGNIGGDDIGLLKDTWQLWAIVYDMRNGIMYSVRDAKTVTLITDRLHPVSGMGKQLLTPDVDSGDAGFIFGAVNDGNTDRLPHFDDWAIYKRALTIPEMSGFALSGIAVSPVASPVNTSFKQTLGYWEFSTANEEVYDPLGVNGTRYNDSSWYRHHLTNVSGSFEISETNLNTRINSQSLQINTSGGMLSLEQDFTGSNLDLSSDLVFPASGFSAGLWMQLPDHGADDFFDLASDHHLMGAWGTDTTDQAWQLGVRDNKPFLSVHMKGGGIDTLVGDEDVPSGTPFFLGATLRPSGANATAEIYIHTGDFEVPGDLRLVGRDTGFVTGDSLNSGSESGFSLFNVPTRNQGFPADTIAQGPFLYAGGLNALEMADLAQAGVDNTTLTSGLVSAIDPANVSHWRFDQGGQRVLDHGQGQNYLFINNLDSHLVGVTPAIHNNAVVVRQTEYLDTLASNPQSSGLDLGVNNESWTFLSWVVPPAVSLADEHVILNKGSGPALAPTGIKIFTTSDSLRLRSVASGNVTEAQNGDLAPNQWNHIAVVFDKDNNEYTTIVNGRYAGVSFSGLFDIPANNSGLVLGGRGDQLFSPIAGGSAFSGLLDDSLLFRRALTLPEISGIAANTYSYNDNSQVISGMFGGWTSGLSLDFVSGLIGSFVHGIGEASGIFGGHISGISGVLGQLGGFVHGKAISSGLAGGFAHGTDSVSGMFGHFIHGLGVVSGLVGSYEFGACEALDEFDMTLTFQILTSEDFDARLGVEKTMLFDFDSRLGVFRITQPPSCSMELPLVGTIASGVPFELTVQGSGVANDQKDVKQVRFTFADFKGAESGTLVGGEPNSGLYEATRTFDTPGWYNVKIEVLDSYGYRSTCCQPFLLVPSGSTSGAYLATLPGISLSGTPDAGNAIHRVRFTHSLSSLDNTSGILEYTDFANQQESLVNSMEMPSGSQFVEFVREHDYTMPGSYCPVWAVSGSWGIVSDTLSDGIDYLG